MLYQTLQKPSWRFLCTLELVQYACPRDLGDLFQSTEFSGCDPKTLAKILKPSSENRLPEFSIFLRFRAGEFALYYKETDQNFPKIDEESMGLQKKGLYVCAEVRLISLYSTQYAPGCPPRCHGGR